MARRKLVTAVTKADAMSGELRRCTARHRMLVLAYLETMDLGEAAKRAGMARQSAYLALQQPPVQAALRAEQAKVAETMLVTSGRLAAELGRIATSDLRGAFCRYTGRLLDPDEWPDSLAAAVSSIKFDKDTGLPTEIKLWPKVEAARLLAQYLGMLQPDPGKVDHHHVHEVKLSDGGAELLKAALAGLERPTIDITPDTGG